MAILVFGPLGIARAQSGIVLEGTVFANFQGNSVTFGADVIRNARSGGRSGTLQLSVWVTEARYDGGTISGYPLATVTLDPLSAGYQYSSVS